MMCHQHISICRMHRSPPYIAAIILVWDELLVKMNLFLPSFIRWTEQQEENNHCGFQLHVGMGRDV